MSEETSGNPQHDERKKSPSWWDNFWFVDALVWLVTLPFRIIVWFMAAILESWS